MFSKAKWKTLVKNILFVLLLVLLFLGLCWIFRRKYAYERYGSFYDRTEDYDVLFLGTSHVMNGIYPMDLWEDYGITSYNLGVPNSQIASSYWIMEIALDYTKPELVVLDVSTIGKNNKIKNAESLHKMFDNFPLSKTKLRAVWDLFEPDDRDEKSYELVKQKYEFVSDFLLYHNRWGELEEEDFHPVIDAQKGGCFYADIADDVPFTVIDRSLTNQEETISKEYLRKFIQECRKRDIEVMLMYLPSSINEEIQMEVNSVDAIAAEYGVNFLNFMYVDDLVRYPVDFHDLSNKGGHLNPSGARKVTAYLGQYIVDNYAIEDHRQDPQYSIWHKDFEEYAALEKEKIGNRTELAHYLTFLPDKNMDVYVYVKQKSAVLSDQRILSGISNLSIQHTIELPRKGDFLVCVDQSASEAKVIEGVAGLSENERNQLSLPEYSWQLEDDVPDLQVVVIDHTTKELIDVGNWSKQNGSYRRIDNSDKGE